EPRLHEKCSDARRATKVERSFCSTSRATPQLGTFRANPSGRCLAGRSALLRALRIVWLFDCGSRRASRPAKQRRGPMGFCISLPLRFVRLMVVAGGVLFAACAAAQQIALTI